MYGGCDGGEYAFAAGGIGSAGTHGEGCGSVEALTDRDSGDWWLHLSGDCDVGGPVAAHLSAVGGTLQRRGAGGLGRPSRPGTASAADTRAGRTSLPAAGSGTDARGSGLL